jgi:hypothetical protein
MNVDFIFLKNECRLLIYMGPNMKKVKRKNKKISNSKKS